ncbi:MAG: epimerase [Melioribacteraceae bacterium]|nr:MAG: epimerase [Melioribacteraceae bacterium]
MKKRIVITGATGLIGKKLVKRLLPDFDITIFSRSIDNAKKVFPECKIVKYNYATPDDWEEELEGVYGVVHLAGENVASGRWTKMQKQKIYNSRIISTENLVNVINKSDVKPEVFVTSSATGYYGYSDTEVFTEDSPAGDGFLADVCADWEDAATCELPKYVRHVAVRTGVVLDKNEGALAKMLLPFKLFAGGPLGSGKQWMPWIHVDDLVEIYFRAITDETLSGPVNGTAPNPVRMKEFAGTLGKVLGRPSILPVPGFAVKMLMGEASEIALEGANVLPDKLNKSDFNFKYSTLKKALEDLLK